MNKVIFFTIFLFFFISCSEKVVVKKSPDLYNKQLEDRFESKKYDDIKYLLDNPPKTKNLEYFKYLLKYNYLMGTTSELIERYSSKEESFEKNYILALSYFSKGVYHYDKALSYFQKAEKLSQKVGKNKAEFYYNFSLLYEKKENIKKSFEILTKAIEIDPKPKYIIYKSYLLMKTGEFKKAQTKLNSIFDKLKSEKMVIKSYILMQEILKSRKPIPLELREAYFRWVWGLSNNKHIFKLLKAAKKALKDYSQYSEVYTILGMGYYLIDNKSKAFNYLNKAISIDKDDPINYFYLGMLHFNLKQLSKAKNYLKKSEELNRYQPDVYHFLSDLYKEMGDIDVAINYKFNELKLIKKSEIYLELDTLYEKGKLILKRISLLEDLIKRYPELPEPYKRMVSIYQGLAIGEPNPKKRREYDKKMKQYEAIYEDKDSKTVDKKLIEAEVSK